MFMAMYSLVPSSCEAKFCGEPLCASDKLGCAADEKSLWISALGQGISRHSP
jgi:hypothetical protein